MDLTAIVVGIIAAVTSIGGVAIWLKNTMPTISKWTALAKDAVETINDVSVALSPDPITGKVELTAEEITKINADAISLKQQLAVLLGH